MIFKKTGKGVNTSQNRLRLLKIHEDEVLNGIHTICHTSPLESPIRISYRQRSSINMSSVLAHSGARLFIVLFIVLKSTVMLYCEQQQQTTLERPSEMSDYVWQETFRSPRKPIEQRSDELKVSIGDTKLSLTSFKRYDSQSGARRQALTPTSETSRHNDFWPKTLAKRMASNHSRAFSSDFADPNKVDEQQTNNQTLQLEQQYADDSSLPSDQLQAPAQSSGNYTLDSESESLDLLRNKQNKSFVHTLPLWNSNDLELTRPQSYLQVESSGQNGIQTNPGTSSNDNSTSVFSLKRNLNATLEAQAKLTDTMNQLHYNKTLAFERTAVLVPNATLQEESSLLPQANDNEPVNPFQGLVPIEAQIVVAQNRAPGNMVEYLNQKDSDLLEAADEIHQHRKSSWGRRKSAESDKKTHGSAKIHNSRQERQMTNNASLSIPPSYEDIVTWTPAAGPAIRAGSGYRPSETLETEGRPINQTGEYSSQESSLTGYETSANYADSQDNGDRASGEDQVDDDSSKLPQELALNRNRTSRRAKLKERLKVANEDESDVSQQMTVPKLDSSSTSEPLEEEDIRGTSDDQPEARPNPQESESTATRVRRRFKTTLPGGRPLKYVEETKLEPVDPYVSERRRQMNRLAGSKSKNRENIIHSDFSEVKTEMGFSPKTYRTNDSSHQLQWSPPSSEKNGRSSDINSRFMRSNYSKNMDQTTLTGTRTLSREPISDSSGYTRSIHNSNYQLGSAIDSLSKPPVIKTFRLVNQLKPETLNANRTLFSSDSAVEASCRDCNANRKSDDRAVPTIQWSQESIGGFVPQTSPPIELHHHKPRHFLPPVTTSNSIATGSRFEQQQPSQFNQIVHPFRNDQLDLGAIQLSQRPLIEQLPFSPGTTQNMAAAHLSSSQRSNNDLAQWSNGRTNNSWSVMTLPYPSPTSSALSYFSLFPGAQSQEQIMSKQNQPNYQDQKAQQEAKQVLYYMPSTNELDESKGQFKHELPGSPIKENDFVTINLKTYGHVGPNQLFWEAAAREAEQEARLSSDKVPISNGHHPPKHRSKQTPSSLPLMRRPLSSMNLAYGGQEPLVAGSSHTNGHAFVGQMKPPQMAAIPMMEHIRDLNDFAHFQASPTNVGQQLSYLEPTSYIPMPTIADEETFNLMNAAAAVPSSVFAAPNEPRQLPYSISVDGGTDKQFRKKAQATISAALPLASPLTVSDPFGWPASFGSPAAKSLLKVNHVASSPSYLIPSESFSIYPTLIDLSSKQQDVSGYNGADTHLRFQQYSPQSSIDEYWNRNLPVSGDQQPMLAQQSVVRPQVWTLPVDNTNQEPATSSKTKKIPFIQRLRLFRRNKALPHQDGSNNRRYKRGLMDSVTNLIRKPKQLANMATPIIQPQTNAKPPSPPIKLPFVDSGYRNRSHARTSYIPLIDIQNLHNLESDLLAQTRAKNRQRPASNVEMDLDSASSFNPVSSVSSFMVMQPSMRVVSHLPMNQPVSLHEHLNNQVNNEPPSTLFMPTEQTSGSLEPPANEPGVLKPNKPPGSRERLKELSKNIIKSSRKPLDRLMKMTNFANRYQSNSTLQTTSRIPEASQQVSIAHKLNNIVSPSVMLSHDPSMDNFNRFALPIQQWYQFQQPETRAKFPPSSSQQPLLPLTTHSTQPFSPYTFITDSFHPENQQHQSMTNNHLLPGKFSHLSNNVSFANPLSVSDESSAKSLFFVDPDTKLERPPFYNSNSNHFKSVIDTRARRESLNYLSKVVNELRFQEPHFSLIPGSKHWFSLRRSAWPVKPLVDFQRALEKLDEPSFSVRRTTSDFGSIRVTGQPNNGHSLQQNHVDSSMRHSLQPDSVLNQKPTNNQIHQTSGSQTNSLIPKRTIRLINTRPMQFSSENYPTTFKQYQSIPLSETRYHQRQVASPQFMYQFPGQQMAESSMESLISARKANHSKTLIAQAAQPHRYVDNEIYSASSTPVELVSNELEALKLSQTPSILDNSTQLDPETLNSLLAGSSTSEIQPLKSLWLSSQENKNPDDHITSSTSTSANTDFTLEQQQQFQKYLSQNQHRQFHQMFMQPTSSIVGPSLPKPRFTKFIPSINSMANKFRQHLYQTFRLNPLASKWPNMLGSASSFISTYPKLPGPSFQFPMGTPIESHPMSSSFYNFGSSSLDEIGGKPSMTTPSELSFSQNSQPSQFLTQAPQFQHQPISTNSLHMESQFEIHNPNELKASQLEASNEDGQTIPDAQQILPSQDKLSNQVFGSTDDDKHQLVELVSNGHELSNSSHLDELHSSSEPEVYDQEIVDNSALLNGSPTLNSTHEFGAQPGQLNEKLNEMTDVSNNLITSDGIYIQEEMTNNSPVQPIRPVHLSNRQLRPKAMRSQTKVPPIGNISVHHNHIMAHDGSSRLEPSNQQANVYQQGPQVNEESQSADSQEIGEQIEIPSHKTIQYEPARIQAKVQPQKLKKMIQHVKNYGDKVQKAKVKPSEQNVDYQVIKASQTEQYQAPNVAHQITNETVTPLEQPNEQSEDQKSDRLKDLNATGESQGEPNTEDQQQQLMVGQHIYEPDTQSLMFTEQPPSEPQNVRVQQMRSRIQSRPPLRGFRPNSGPIDLGPVNEEEQEQEQQQQQANDGNYTMASSVLEPQESLPGAPFKPMLVASKLSTSDKNIEAVNHNSSFNQYILVDQPVVLTSSNSKLNHNEPALNLSSLPEQPVVFVSIKPEKVVKQTRKRPLMMPKRAKAQSQWHQANNDAPLGESKQNSSSINNNQVRPAEETGKSSDMIRASTVAPATSLVRDSFTRPPKAKIRWQGMGSGNRLLSGANNTGTNKSELASSETSRSEQAWIVGGMTLQSYAPDANQTTDTSESKLVENSELSKEDSLVSKHKKSSYPDTKTMPSNNRIEHSNHRLEETSSSEVAPISRDSDSSKYQANETALSQFQTFRHHQNNHNANHWPAHSLAGNPGASRTGSTSFRLSSSVQPSTVSSEAPQLSTPSDGLDGSTTPMSNELPVRATERPTVFRRAVESELWSMNASSPADLSESHTHHHEDQWSLDRLQGKRSPQSSSMVDSRPWARLPAGSAGADTMSLATSKHSND